MPRKHAILIGVEVYDDPRLRPVDFAANDVLDLGKALRECCGFDQVRCLCDGGDAPPTYLSISTLLAEASKDLREDDLLFFHASAHGVEVEGRRYLLTADTPAHEFWRGVPLAALHSWLHNVDALRRAIVLDICRDDPFKDRASGHNAMGENLGRDIDTMRNSHREDINPTVAILSGCKPGERAYPWFEVRHGLLSHFLINHIRESPDGYLDFDGLCTQATKSILRWCEKDPVYKQTPWFETSGPKRSIVLRESRVSPPRPPSPPLQPPKRRFGFLFATAIALVVISLCLYLSRTNLWLPSPSPSQSPQIRITEVPPFDDGTRTDLVAIKFQVTGKIPDGSRVFLYSLTSRWFGQPTPRSPVSIAESGQGSAWIRPGREYAALLVTAEFQSPDTVPPDQMPPSMANVLAKDIEHGKP